MASLGTRTVTSTAALAMSRPATRSANSGSSSTSCIDSSYDHRADAAAAVRRSQGQAESLVRGLEAPLRSPEVGSRRQTQLRGQARQDKTTSANDRGHSLPGHQPPAPQHQPAKTGGTPGRQRPAQPGFPATAGAGPHFHAVAASPRGRMTQFEPPVPTPRGEPVWLQPFPDALLEGAAGVPPGPEARYEQTESISLAFVTALQVLPPRQVAVLILRDVLGFHASEVAGMLDTTVDSVTSALKRARASLQRREQPATGHHPPPAAGSPAEDALVAKFARAWESTDLDALVALLTDDVFIAMPPMPFGYEGRDVVIRFCA